MVMDRSKGKCENPKCRHNGEYSLHHCYFKSQYFGKDRDMHWNLSNICNTCHDLLHHQGGGRELDVYLKEQALDRYHGNDKTKLEIIYRQKFYGYKQSLERDTA